MIRPLAIAAALSIPLFLGTACSKYNIRDIDPEKPGKVRSLGPESQDVIQLSDLMVRSLMASDEASKWEQAPTIAMLPMANNTRYAFNQEVFSSRLKVQLNKDAKGRIMFLSRDVIADIEAERELKRDGKVDYDPKKRAATPAGADYFLKGYANGLAAVSTKGQADYIVYTFKLIDAETSVEVWEDVFETKKEGKDDVIYR